jgi:exopolysaccharide biosynthesis protein
MKNFLSRHFRFAAILSFVLIAVFLFSLLYTFVLHKSFSSTEPVSTAKANTVTLRGITPSQLTTTVGQQETITVSASGGSELLYQYKIYNYLTKDWCIVQDYSTDPILKWTFKSAGKYQIMCLIKDKASANQYDCAAYCEMTVNPPVDIYGSYENGNIEISIEKFRKYNTTMYVADIQISDGYSLKTAFANNTFGQNITEKTSDIAKAHNSIFAINGDFYGYLDADTGSASDGFVLRNGVVYRDTASRSDPEALVIDSDGSLSVVNEKETDINVLKKNGAWQIFSMGPTLVKNSEIALDGTETDTVANPRTALGQVSKLHYIAIVADGRSSENRGVTLSELAIELKERGCTIAYNLDGGGSSTMYFKGEVINNPAEGYVIGERKVSDIIYIGD